MKKKTTGTVKASDSAKVTVSEAPKKASVKQAPAKKAPRFAPTTNGLDESVKPSSTLPEGKTFNEVAQAEAEKATKKSSKQKS